MSDVWCQTRLMSVVWFQTCDVKCLMSGVKHQTPDIRVWHQTTNIRLHTLDIRCLRSYIIRLTLDNRRQTTNVSDIRCLSSDFWHQTFDIRCLTLDSKHQTSEIRSLTSDVLVWHQTSDVWHGTTNIRRHTSDTIHQTSDIRQQTSDTRRETSSYIRNHTLIIRCLMSYGRRLVSDVFCMIYDVWCQISEVRRLTWNITQHTSNITTSFPGFPSYPPYGARERERDPGKRWSRVSQNLGDYKQKIWGRGR